ncbi:uncharacterized protein LOC113355129 isoform X2 [Papaver somniferum]|uniref:uncharacterized protein LOC113355129 isoform X2 n=1 Tax=Papaver somniferum TaxID=3469 RepID=UPI000E6FCFA2|nr:uncharacterized protein LOC113355129 isoform X2 [Papaver somniferum]
MARIIKKAASSLTPVLLAYPRTAHRSSSIFITPQLKNSRNTISRSSSLIYRQDVLFRTTTRHFSSSIGKKRPPESDKIISAGEEAEKDLLKKEENSDESDNQNDQDKDSVNDPQSSIRLVVTNTNYLGTTLVYGVIAYPDGFSIDSFCIKYAYAPDEENIYYKGLDYAKLDNDLQKEYQRRLKIIGITPGTTNFLHEYMANRDMYSSDSSNSPPPTTTTTTTTIDQITPESLLTTFLNDEGIPANPAIEQYRQRGHPLVSAEEIRNSGKHPKDFIWIPYPYHRSEKLLWIEVPSKGHYATESEIEEYCIEAFGGEDFLDGEAYEANPYRCLPRKALGDPPVISEEMDKILYPDLKHANDPKKGCNVALRPYFDEMNKIKYHPDRDPDVVIFACDINREVY